jgi:hypothetical protein
LDWGQVKQETTCDYGLKRFEANFGGSNIVRIPFDVPVGVD